MPAPRGQPQSNLENFSISISRISAPKPRSAYNGPIGKPYRSAHRSIQSTATAPATTMMNLREFPIVVSANVRTPTNQAVNDAGSQPLRVESSSGGAVGGESESGAGSVFKRFCFVELSEYSLPLLQLRGPGSNSPHVIGQLRQTFVAIIHNFSPFRRKHCDPLEDLVDSHCSVPERLWKVPINAGDSLPRRG